MPANPVSFPKLGLRVQIFSFSTAQLFSNSVLLPFLPFPTSFWAGWQWLFPLSRPELSPEKVPRFVAGKSSPPVAAAAVPWFWAPTFSFGQIFNFCVFWLACRCGLRSSSSVYASLRLLLSSIERSSHSSCSSLSRACPATDCHPLRCPSESATCRTFDAGKQEHGRRTGI